MTAWSKLLSALVGAVPISAARVGAALLGAALLGAALFDAALLGAAFGQGAPRAAEVEVGFGGAVVADAWNPLRLTLRDVDAGTLRLRLDVGTLLEGEIPWVIDLPFRGGPGVSVIERDVYLPPWREATWAVEVGGAVVASGAWARDRATAQPVTLLVGAEPIDRAEAERLGVGERWIDVAAGSLPVRAAAYDGVAAVVVRNDDANVAALTAAAVAGAHVSLRGDAAGGTVAQALLGDRDLLALGAGGVTRGEAAAPFERAGRDAALAEALAASALGPPDAAPWSRVAVVVATYLAALGLAVRIGGAPGGATAALAFAAALGFAQLPESAGGARLEGEEQERRRILSLAAGGLAWTVEVIEVFRLAPGAIERAGTLRPEPLQSASFALADQPTTRLTVGRARAVVLIGAPQVALAVVEP